MRSNARQPHPQGRRGQAADLPAPAPTPNTPRKDGVTLNALVRSLEADWHLGLAARDNTWSPSKSNDALADKVYGQLKRLHFSSGPALDQALSSFKQIAPGFEHAERLKLLHGTLRSQTQSPLSRAGTPLGTEGTRNVPLKTLKLSQPCEYL